MTKKSYTFDTEDAMKYGVTAAILLENIRWWIDHNKANESNFYDGRYWTYNSVKAFQKLFPFFGASVIKTAIKKLVKEGVLIEGNYNATPYDRTKWYALKCEDEGHIDDKDDDFQKANIASSLANMANDKSHNDQPIPDIKPDINTDINTDICVSEEFSIQPLYDWGEKNGFSKSKIKFNYEYFIDYIKNRSKKPYKDLRAAFRNCVRSDWGGYDKPSSKRITRTPSIQDQWDMVHASEDK